MKKTRGSLKERLLRRLAFIPHSGCWLWTGYVAKSGHGKISQGVAKPGYAHRVAWEVLRGPIPTGTMVLHKCNVPSCVNPDNLYLGTAKENVADAIAAGVFHHPNRRLTPDIVAAIRRDKRLHREIAADYGLCRSYVSALKKGLGWRGANVR